MHKLNKEGMVVNFIEGLAEIDSAESSVKPRDSQRLTMLQTA